MYPNPAHDKVMVEMRNDLKWKSIVLYSAHGKAVLQVEGNSKDTATLDVRHLPKGLYVLQIQTDKGIISKKIVLN